MLQLSDAEESDSDCDSQCEDNMKKRKIEETNGENEGTENGQPKLALKKNKKMLSSRKIPFVPRST
jgi:hypothetical protein